MMPARPGVGLLSALMLSSGAAWPQGASEWPASAEEVEMIPVAAATENEAGSEAPPPADLAEVVVTARKREENLRDIPVSATPFTGSELRSLGVSSPTDLSRVTPGLVYDNFVGFSVIYLRGVGTDQFLPSGDSSVTSYIDGVYTPFAHALAQEFVEIERVEILKGPQGTLFGRNSTGGAINILTKAPEQQPSATLATSAGDFDARSARAYLTGGLGDSLRLGLAARYSERDSYYDRPSGSPRPPFATERSRGLQARLDWDASDTMTLSLAALLTDQDGTGTALVSAMDTKPLFRLLVLESPEPFTSDPDVAPRLKADNTVFYGIGEWQGPRFDAKLTGSFQEVSTFTQFDFEGSPTPLATFRPRDMGARITTAELQLLSNPGSLWPERLQWTAGYYFFDGRDQGFRDVQFTLAESLTDPLLSGPLGLVDGLLERIGLPLGVPDGVKLFLNGLVDTRSHSVYAQASLGLSRGWRLTLGGRYLREERALTESRVALLLADDSPADPPLRRFAPRQRDYSDFSPKVTLDYRFNDGPLVFLSWQEGYKSGTFNVLNLFREPSEVQPERITAWELGIKGEARDWGLRYSAAAFHNRIDNLQVLILSLQSSGAVTLENAPETVIQGIDAALQWLPLRRRLPGLRLDLGAALLDGEYTEYPNGTGFDERTGLFRSDLDFTGNESMRAPRFTGRAGLRYGHFTRFGAIEAGVSFYYSDDYFFDQQNAIAQPAFHTLQAQISAQHRRSGLSLTLFGDNLTDSTYFLNQFQTDFNTVGTLAAPRTYGLRLEWQLQ
ncbi:TonB-dependent receptor [Algiphilus aromaticivorans]|uniref:TonB-dependent receptor n=1 Tax=Algiphilus aromaticivorans TaxID=382454 RepID=UPI0005C1FFCC|nr:TonB-dependent receptor [Algiphilus aromaticivorans]